MKKFKSFACHHYDIGEIPGTLQAIRHHATIIFRTYVEHGRNVWQLDTGGHQGNWNTPSQAIGSVTTRRKLNEIASHFGFGFSIHQHRHVWYVTTKAGTYKWDDSTTFVIDAETGMPFDVVRLFTEEKAA